MCSRTCACSVKITPVKYAWGGGIWLAYGLLLYSFSSSFFQISLTTFQLYNVSAVFPLPSSGIFEMVMIQNNNISPFQIPDEGSGNAAETLYRFERTNYLIIMSAGNSLGYIILLIPCRIVSGDLAKRPGIIAGVRWCESASATWTPLLHHCSDMQHRTSQTNTLV